MKKNNNIMKIENRILDFFSKNYKILFLIFITLFALIIRFKMLDYTSSDYLDFLKPWFDDLKAKGGLKGLANYKGDYNAPYMTIIAFLTYLPLNSLISIKFVSILFDFALALSCALLAKELSNKNKQYYFIMVYSVVLFIPSVMTNSALWCQCDSIYTTFVILSLFFLIKEKYALSFIMLGVAFAFKLQFVFILPLYLVIYVVKRKFSILYFLIIPLVDFLMCMPAIIMGKSVLECIYVYFNQTNTYKGSLVMNFPNIYQIFNGEPNIFYIVGEIIVVAACALALFYIISKKIKFNKEKTFLLGIWFIVIIAFLLPGMHERYLFAGEILSAVYFVIYRKNGFLALFVNLSSLITYSNYLNGFNFKYMDLLSITFLIIICLYTKNVFITLGKNEYRNNKLGV